MSASKWEYRILKASFQSWSEMLPELNRLGDDGWEMVSAYLDRDKHVFAFKRPRPALKVVRDARAKKQTVQGLTALAPPQPALGRK